jgi:hypothetical protein
MELRDYCSNLRAELTGWKAKAYDIVRRLDKLSSGDKAQVVDQVRDLHILVEELENRIERLRKECPTVWSSDQMEIEQKLRDVKIYWEKVWSGMPKKREEKLVQLITDWKSLENDTVALAEDLQKKSDNPFVKVIMEIIKRDSEKHKVMQQFVIDALTKEAVHLSPQELIPLADVLDRHIQAEAKSMGLANACAIESRNYFVDFIVSTLTDDEVKHHNMLRTLDYIKGAVYPYGVVRAE